MKNLLYILVLSIFTSCLSAKKVVKKTQIKTTTEKTTQKKDSVNLTTVNKAIKDNIAVSLRTNNRVVDSIIKQRLKGFVSRKTSGSNSYQAKFDYDKMILDISAIIGQTENTNVATNTSDTSEKTLEQKTDEYISKKIRNIPLWLYIAALFWFSPQIISRLELFKNLLLKVFDKIFKKE